MIDFLLNEDARTHSSTSAHPLKSVRSICAGPMPQGIKLRGKVLLLCRVYLSCRRLYLCYVIEQRRGGLSTGTSVKSWSGDIGVAIELDIMIVVNCFTLDNTLIITKDKIA